MKIEATLPGRSFPPGSTVLPEGVNFCVFSKNCQFIELLFFDDVNAKEPSRIIPLHPENNRTFYYWHILVKGIKPGQLYGYRAQGPFEPETGLRFDGEKILIDPYGKAVAVGDSYDRTAAQKPGSNAHCCMKSVVVDTASYDWEGDMPIHRDLRHSFIYELHVGGFTRSVDSGIAEEKRGTFAGIIEKIPYLKSLGVTEVELLPVQHFDAQDAPLGKPNYWGYSPVSFFAPHSGYATHSDPQAPVREFRDMVKALHRAGIEVILDVVFNHTAEGDHTGPTLSFRGLENRAYYIPDPENRSRYANYSGCGNTFNANQSIARRMILDSLRYWVSEMHVDGFRFDLASVLSRDEWGAPLRSPPILWEIESDPVLAGTRIIAEAWDASGLYQVGSFIGHKWAEWNGIFRDDVRRFVRGDRGLVPKLMQRITGSPDVFPQKEWEPERSINFLTCHDGFTLNDLVSYNQKHNESNGEQNRDGMDENYSWNCGEEGISSNPLVNALRKKQIKNFLTLLFISQGTPMIQMGDEAARTQNGNNNAYCQDNETSWFRWKDLETNAEILRFQRELAEFRKANTVFHMPRFWTSSSPEKPVLRWSGVRLWEPDTGHVSHSIAFQIQEPEKSEKIFVILNAYHGPLDFELPPSETGWKRAIDTSLPAPDDICPPSSRPVVPGKQYTANERTFIVLTTG